MESGLFRDFFGNFSMQGERCYFHVEGSKCSEIEMNIGKLGELGKTFLGGGNLW